MAEPPRTRKKTAGCACGSVELEAIGTPITSVACYCDVSVSRPFIVGCRQRFPRRELLIVQDDRHDNVVFFDGDKVCRPCARRNGVSC
jgi:hypothetical protein